MTYCFNFLCMWGAVDYLASPLLATVSFTLAFYYTNTSYVSQNNFAFLPLLIVLGIWRKSIEILHTNYCSIMLVKVITIIIMKCVFGQKKMGQLK